MDAVPASSFEDLLFSEIDALYAEEAQLYCDAAPVGVLGTVPMMLAHSHSQGSCEPMSPVFGETSASEGGEDESGDNHATTSEVTSLTSSPKKAGARAAAAASGTVLFASPPRNGRRFKGVRHRKWGKYTAEIRDAIGKRIWLGSYDAEEEAARVYDMAARILQGEGAWLNFPNEDPGCVTLPKATVDTLIKHRANTAQRQLAAPVAKKVRGAPRHSMLSRVSAPASPLGFSPEQTCCPDDLGFLPGIISLDDDMSPASSSDASWASFLENFNNIAQSEAAATGPLLNISEVESLLAM